MRILRALKALRIPAAAALLVCALMLASFASAQEAPPAPPPTPPQPQPQPPAEPEDPNLIALNLNNVGVDQIVNFLSDLTGKPVMKHKDVNAQITIASTKKVPRDAALKMIAEALSLNNVAIVERNEIVWLVPNAMIPQLDTQLATAADELPRVGIISKTIPVNFADIAEIEKLVRPLLNEKATVIARPGSRKIIVTDTVERIANLERVMAQLDVLDVDNRQVQIFQLLHADAEELAPILRSGMAGQGGAPAEGGQPPKKTAGVEILPYKAANWLLVVAPKESMEKIVALVAQFDQEMPQDVRPRVVEVKYADADSLAQRLSALLQKRGLKRLRDTIEIIADARSNNLVILASEPNYKMVQTIVAELDTEQSVQMKPEWFELKYADAEDLAEQMNDLYSGMQQDPFDFYYFYYGSRQNQQKTHFVAERRTNSLIAIAQPTELEQIRDIVKRLDQPISKEQVQPRIFQIRNSDAKEISEILNRIFGVEDSGKQGGYYDYLIKRSGMTSKVGRLYGQVRFDPVPSTNSIIVTTNNKENFGVVEEFITKLDQTMPEAANLLVIPLRHAKAADMARQLNVLFAQEGARAPEKKEENGESAESYYTFLYGSKKEDERLVSELIGQVRVVDDVRTNTLLITSPVQYHEALRDLVKGLDVVSPKVFVSVRLVEIIHNRGSRVGMRISSDPSVFESEDFEEGLVGTFGFKWEDVHSNGILSSNINIAALIQFLAKTFNSRILSDTTITINNNEEGVIFVGSQIPFITNSQISPEGTRNDSYEYKNAGTELTLTPNINNEKRVVMNIKFETSQIRAGVQLFGGAILDTRRFGTLLAVNSGQTIVMGGILREEQVESVRGVPILRHIPLINLIFRKKDKHFEVTELVAFITPVVLETEKDDAARTRDVLGHMKDRNDLDLELPKE